MYILTVLDKGRGFIVGASEQYSIIKEKMEELTVNKKREGYEELTKEDNYVWLIKDKKDYTLSIINKDITSKDDFYSLITYINVKVVEDTYSDITIDNTSFTELEIKEYLKNSLKELERDKKNNEEDLDIILFDENSKYICKSDETYYYASIHKVKIIS